MLALSWPLQFRCRLSPLLISSLPVALAPSYPQDVFVERNALELKGTHIGWTCPQVKEMVAASMGGCLFLDEAYGLCDEGFSAGGDPFAKEAIRTLLTEVENNRTSLMVVLAGYKARPPPPCPDVLRDPLCHAACRMAALCGLPCLRTRRTRWPS